MNVSDLPWRMAQKIVVSAAGCWEWHGARGKSKQKGAGGYPLYTIDGRMQLLHRWTYRKARGPIPEGLVLDHLCRVRHCVNPDHLEAVTPLENARRAFWAQRTHCQNGHEFTAENTWRRRDRINTRICKECNRINRERYLTKRRHQLADAGYAQPTALGATVLVLLAVLLGVSTGPGVGLAFVASLFGGRLLFLVARGVVDSDRARAWDVEIHPAPSRADAARAIDGWYR